ncbi:MAG: pyridoxamine 5'-phosphate oxidase family protein [Actinomycetota bacterium]|nr:pyridoxamine 5'-phosphate oxidase family protein [Actinomycetota bacterium]
MSIAVALEDLADKLVEYPWCYLVTSGEDRPHLLAVRPAVVKAGLRCATGHSSRANVVRDPLVVLMFPPQQPDGFSLLVDGEGAVDGDGILVKPTWAVLHRPAV